MELEMSPNAARPSLDIYEAIDADLAVSRVSRKEMAMVLWPGRRPETAMSVFSRAMLAETDVHLTIEHVIAIMRRTGGAHVIAYLCDSAGYERPAKKRDEAAREEMRRMLNDLMIQVRDLAKQLVMEAP